VTTNVCTELVKRGIAPIALKSLTGAGYPVRRGVVSVEEAMQYAMSIPGVAVTVSGIDSTALLEQNLMASLAAKTLAAYAYERVGQSADLRWRVPR
jgi:hypothetical protein